jgi:hypothetical protein
LILWYLSFAIKHFSYSLILEANHLVLAFYNSVPLCLSLANCYLMGTKTFVIMTLSIICDTRHKLQWVSHFIYWHAECRDAIWWIDCFDISWYFCSWTRQISCLFFFFFFFFFFLVFYFEISKLFSKSCARSAKILVAYNNFLQSARSYFEKREFNCLYLSSRTWLVLKSKTS